MKIGSVEIGPDVPPVVIAEIGISHRGNLEVAKESAKVAIEYGARIVKTQLHLPEESLDPTPLVDLSLNTAQLAELKAYVESLGAEFLCTPFCVAAVHELQKIGVKAYKLGGGGSANGELVTAVCKTRKPMIVSTALNNDVFDSNLWDACIMHTVAEYPAKFDGMLNGFDYTDTMGISDHCPGIAISLGAVALGACVVEKHFAPEHMLALDRPFPDDSVSIGQYQLRELVDGAHAIWTASTKERDFEEAEAPVAEWATFRIVTTKPIKRGRRITKNNVTTKRARSGIKASEWDWLMTIRKVVAAINIPAGVALEEGMVADG